MKVCQSLSESLFTVRYSVSCNQKGSVNALARSPRSRRFSACFCSKGSHLQLFFRSLLPAYLLFSCSVVSNSATPRTAACQAALFSTVSQSLLKLMSIESVMPSNHLILSHSLLLPPAVFPSISVFSNESALRVRWPKYWSFSFNISPSSEQPGLISSRMDWLDLLAVQGTLKSPLQHHSLKASIFSVHLSSQSNSHIHT